MRTVANLQFASPATTRAFAKAMTEVNVTLPIDLDQEDAATIVDADGKIVCVVDPNSDRPNTEVVQIAMWIVCAVNTCGGFAAVGEGASA
jgi:hypothetical protein